MLWNRTIVCAAQLSLLAALGLLTSSAQAQNSEAKEKERLYTYVALWQVPRGKWAEYEKASPANQKILDQGIGDGTLVSYGDDFNLVHSAEGYTHDNWWASHSEAGLMKILTAFDKLPATSNGVHANTKTMSDPV